MTRLILQPGPSGREQIAARKAARSLGIEMVSGNAIQPGDVPVGDVPFCSEIMRRQGIAVPKPDFYPEFLSEWMHRTFAIQDHTRMGSDRVFFSWFVKAADEYKAYPARILNARDRWPVDGRFIMSEVVNFTQEWRYYLADGQLVTSGWYDGNNEDEPAPSLSIDWPKGFCGAVDFGRLDTGKIALVESHHPFACGERDAGFFGGWYGDDAELFVLWLIEGWESFK